MRIPLGWGGPGGIFIAHMKHEAHSSFGHTKVCGSERGLQSGEQGAGDAGVHMSSHREEE